MQSLCKNINGPKYGHFQELEQEVVEFLIEGKDWYADYM
jgi:hypothetical protein